MPLIKVTTSDGKVTKLCTAKDILGLKEIGNPLILEFKRQSRSLSTFKIKLKKS
jgi:hypothetical protein